MSPVNKSEEVPSSWQSTPTQTDLSVDPVEIEKMRTADLKDRVVLGLGVVFVLLMIVASGSMGWMFTNRKVEKVVPVVVEEAKAVDEVPAPMKLKIKVLNGSGKSGVAGALAKRLDESLFEILEVGNADESVDGNQLIVPEGVELSESQTNAIVQAGFGNYITKTTASSTVVLIIGR